MTPSQRRKETGSSSQQPLVEHVRSSSVHCTGGCDPDSAPTVQAPGVSTGHVPDDWGMASRSIRLSNVHGLWISQQFIVLSC